MTKPIKITLRGVAEDGDDAPKVSDLLAQVGDLLDVLTSVEKAVLQGGDSALEWRVTGMTKRSPCSVQIAPYPSPKQTARRTDQLADQVVDVVANGLQQFAAGQPHPRFTSDAVRSIRRVCRRMLNGLGDTTVDFSGYKALPNFTAKRTDAKQLLAVSKQLGKPETRFFKETGSVEGYIVGFQLDNTRHPTLRVLSRSEKRIVTCSFPKNQLGELGEHTLDRLVEGMRVEVSGIIIYDDLRRMKKFVATHVDVLKPDELLPSLDDVVVPNYTGGLDSVEYLAKVREEFYSDD